MTVIIAALFLPYTVKFEVDVKSPSPEIEEQQPVTVPTPGSPKLIVPLILNAHATPAVPQRARKGSEDGFFRRRLKSSSNLSEERFIQPKPRLQKQPNSSVVDVRAPKELHSTPSLKVSLSSTSLASGAHQSQSLRAARGSTSGPLGQWPIFSLSNNSNSSLNDTSSTGSISNTTLVNRNGPSAPQSLNAPLNIGRKLSVDSSKSSVEDSASVPTPLTPAAFSNSDSTTTIVPPDTFQEIDADDWQHQFNDLVHGRSAQKLTPFGGFSKHGNVLNVNPVFDNAPWKIVYNESGNGLLIKAVKLASQCDVIDKRKWVGTLAMPADVVLEDTKQLIGTELQNQYHCEPVFPKDYIFEGHYKLFCKQILWPTFHYQIPDDPKSKAFEDHSWDQYYALNQMIADRVVNVYLEEQKLAPDVEHVIWVHDYHLLLVPQMIRDKLPDARIGFFLHISFPSSEVFKVFATRKELLRGMLGANCITFQTTEYVRHFLQTTSRLLLADSSSTGITFEGRSIVVNTIPVGIDTPTLEAQLASLEVKEWRSQLRERWSNQRLIVSRDQLDKFRGIKQKLLAYEKFLTLNPERALDTVLIQLCIGKSDPEYEAKVMQIVARINAIPDSFQAQPVIFIQHDIEFEQYLALLCEADVFAVTSMREGLNLTCHEAVVAAQFKKSPLILSEFTGSSPLLYNGGIGALLVNPWDLKQVSEAFHTALFMSTAEKEERWLNCYNTVKKHDSKHWVENCLSLIKDAWNEERLRVVKKLFKQDTLNDIFASKTPRLLILNLETQSWDKIDSFAEPRILQPFKDLLNDPLNHIFLLLYLRRSDLDMMYERSPNLGLIAENGGYIKFPGCSGWLLHAKSVDDDSWMFEVKKLVQLKVDRLPGLSMEVEDCTIRFHPGRSLQDERARALDIIGDLIEYVNESSEEVHATLIRTVVVIQKKDMTLSAVKSVISHYRGHSQKIAEDFSMQKVDLMNNEVLESLVEVSQSIGLLLIAGGSTAIDEPAYLYGEGLKGLDVFTVAVVGPNENSSARYAVGGKNELLGMFAKLTEAKKGVM